MPNLRLSYSVCLGIDRINAAGKPQDQTIGTVRTLRLSAIMQKGFVRTIVLLQQLEKLDFQMNSR
jgi:hypothetical protein